MKFEHVLRIYWSKGFLFTNILELFGTPFKRIFQNSGLINTSTRHLVVTRFELYNIHNNFSTDLSSLDDGLKNAFNIFLSQLSSVNGRIHELKKLSLVKLYLIKTMRGRSHALGKPSRGQRSWSNAWTSYNCNKTTRGFLTNLQKIFDTQKKTKKNYKLTQKREKKSTVKIKILKEKLSTISWF